MKKGFKIFCAIYIAVTVGFIIEHRINIRNERVKKELQEEIDILNALHEAQLLVLKQKELAIIKNELVKQVDSVIQKYSANTSKITASYFVDKCLEYDVDIIFALSQCNQETNLGKISENMGLAGKCKSICSLGIFTNAKKVEDVPEKYKYFHIDQSIEPYLKQLKRTYIVNGKTEQDMMRNFVNLRGERYAAHRGYERNIRATYRIIEKKSNIDELQKRNQIMRETIILRHRRSS